MLLYGSQAAMPEDFSVRGFPAGQSEAMGTLTVTVSSAAPVPTDPLWCSQSLLFAFCEVRPVRQADGRADYVLWDDNHQPLAVIEAKSTQVDAEAGRQQAKLYADWLEEKYGQRPVIFYTNGYDIFIWDDHPAHGYPPRRLFGFYSKASLQHLIQQRTSKKDLLQTDIDTSIAGGGTRLYQLESIRRVAESFSNKKRSALIVQATGTGKTRVSIALTKLLLDARWVKRVLFLCDRKELRKQARNAFNEFISECLPALSPLRVMLRRTAPSVICGVLPSS
jgi:type I restriction enzyme R subunit